MTSNAKKILSFTVILTIILSVVLFSQEKKPMTFVDTINLKRVSSPSLSPDGTQILFTITNADWEKNRAVSHIWRLDTDGKGLVQMTNGKEGESGGIWSPDGTIISFITKRNEEEGDSQIFFMNTSGGKPIEFSAQEGGALSHTWSPNGKKIYFTARDALSEEEEQKKEDKDDAFIFEMDEKNTHIWVIDVQTKKEKKGQIQ